MHTGILSGVCSVMLTILQFSNPFSIVPSTIYSLRLAVEPLLGYNPTRVGRAQTNYS